MGICGHYVLWSWFFYNLKVFQNPVFFFNRLFSRENIIIATIYAYYKITDKKKPGDIPSSHNQFLRLCALNAKGGGLIYGQETISHMAQLKNPHTRVKSGDAQCHS